MMMMSVVPAFIDPLLEFWDMTLEGIVKEKSPTANSEDCPEDFGQQSVSGWKQDDK